MIRRTAQILGGATFALALTALRDAAAQVALGVDTSAVGGGTNAGWGPGVDGRFGYRTGPPRSLIVHSIVLQLEGIAGYRHIFSSAGDVDLGRLGGGLRLGGLLGWFEPFVVAHLSAADATGNWGYLIDLGGAADWRLRTWSLGIHYAHDWLHIASGSEHFEEIGLHAEVRGFWL